MCAGKCVGVFVYTPLCKELLVSVADSETLQLPVCGSHGQ